ncbi:MAG: Phosphate-specific transport system accessory protein PhoU [Chloroflexi bacterium]|jgi:phosphate transport system protein|nr:Phosphate-specific transport system accessory protein PhoU [Chloroflexota bacterium]
MALRENYSIILNKLQDDLLFLGSLVSKATGQAVEAMINRDPYKAERVIAGDIEINMRRFEWEEKALLVLATQNPVASDLRFIAAGIHIVDELERMGDHAKGVARISLNIGNVPLIFPKVPLPEMSRIACNMLDQSLIAFTNRDAALALKTGEQDDILDNLYNTVQGDLLELMLADRANIQQANLLLWSVHNLERIGDRITNICERVIFVATGQMQEIPGSYSRRLTPS